MRVIGIIQARLASSRLPAKVLAPLAGRPLLEILVHRLRQVPGNVEPIGEPKVDAWWLATTHEASDDVLAAWGRSLGLEVHRGDEDDVLSRYTEILDKDPSDWVIRVTADDPFMDGHFIHRVLPYLEGLPDEIDLIGDLEPRRLPLGYAPQFIRSKALQSASRDIPDEEPWHRVHAAATWILQQDRGATFPFDLDDRGAHWRLTVDTKEDFALASRVFELLGEDWHLASIDRLLAVLEHHPELASLNEAIQQKDIEHG